MILPDSLPQTYVEAKHAAVDNTVGSFDGILTMCNRLPYNQLEHVEHFSAI